MRDLTNLREQIDSIDSKILILIKKRISLMRETGLVKKKLQTHIRDKERESEKITVLEAKAKDLKIPENLVKKIWHIFFETSVEIEK